MARGVVKFAHVVDSFSSALMLLAPRYRDFVSSYQPLVATADFATTRVLRPIMGKTRSSGGLLVRIDRQCVPGKAKCASVSWPFLSWSSAAYGNFSSRNLFVHALDLVTGTSAIFLSMDG
jgi:hypothetical protein